MWVVYITRFERSERQGNLSQVCFWCRLRMNRPEQILSVVAGGINPRRYLVQNKASASETGVRSGMGATGVRITS
jgi:hypothetical protein